MDDERQADIATELGPQSIAQIAVEMSSDERTDLIKELPEGVGGEVLATVDDDTTAGHAPTLGRDRDIDRTGDPIADREELGAALVAQSCARAAVEDRGHELAVSGDIPAPD
jgi:hypothetical protein